MFEELEKLNLENGYWNRRYADTNGYQNDRPRYMWRWRDWVIEAFNKNMPFDQFTIEQIAGAQLFPRRTAWIVPVKAATGNILGWRSRISTEGSLRVGCRIHLPETVPA